MDPQKCPADGIRLCQAADERRLARRGRQNHVSTESPRTLKRGKGWRPLRDAGSVCYAGDAERATLSRRPALSPETPTMRTADSSPPVAEQQNRGGHQPRLAVPKDPRHASGGDRSRHPDDGLRRRVTRPRGPAGGFAPGGDLWGRYPRPPGSSLVTGGVTSIGPTATSRPSTRSRDRARRRRRTRGRTTRTATSGHARCGDEGRRSLRPSDTGDEIREDEDSENGHPRERGGRRRGTTTDAERTTFFSSTDDRIGTEMRKPVRS